MDMRNNPDHHYRKIAADWQNLGYSKHSGKRHQVEWALLDALMLIHHDHRLGYISSHTDYPSLPEDEDLASVTLNEAIFARGVLVHFEIAPEEEGEPNRRYWARIGTDLEQHILNKVHKDPEIESIAELAGDFFVILGLQQDRN
jgi:hypothetical protein